MNTISKVCLVLSRSMEYLGLKTVNLKNIQVKRISSFKEYLNVKTRLKYPGPRISRFIKTSNLKKISRCKEYIGLKQCNKMATK